MSRKKITILDLQRKKDEQQPITMLTAYDFTGAQLVDQAEIDVILVGDSLGMVVLGYDSTVPVTMAEMLHHSRAVARGTQYAFTVGDMPFLSYQTDPADAVRNAGLLLKDGRMDSVKLEGGQEMVPTIEAISRAGIPVMGHIGLTPQSQSKLGGYRIQGKTAVSAYNLLQDALALEAAGCFSIVLEAVPELVATAISQKLTIPTIGIGAGQGCDGQVLVYHDLLGMFDRLQPRFVKEYVRLGLAIVDAFAAYRDDVVNGRFPAPEHTYPMSAEEAAAFDRMIAE